MSKFNRMVLRVLSLSLAFVLLLSVLACSAEPSEPASTQPTAAEPSEPASIQPAPAEPSEPASTQSMPEKKVVTIIDGAGQKVEVEVPVERLALQYLDVARMLDITDKVVGIPEWSSKDGTYVTQYYEGLSQLPVVQTFSEVNYEALVELKTQMFIQWVDVGPNLEKTREKLAPYDIGVAGLDFYIHSTHERDLQTLAVLVDREEEAADYIAWHHSILNLISERLQDLPQDQMKTVYFETVSEGAYHSRATRSGDHESLLQAYGINIFADSPIARPQVSAEEVVKRNPDVIIMCSYLPGYLLTEPGIFEELRDEMMSRPELANVNAVKNGQVYVLSSEVGAGLNLAVIEPLFLAKILYPDKLSDVDVNAYHKVWMEEYQQTKYQGIHCYPTP